MTTPIREIAFIDTSITDWETLLAGLNAGVEVILLDPAEDGLRQMANALRNYSDLSAIHLFSHGGSGELILGGMAFNAGTLVDYGDALATIGSALSETGDILLYGCNVAQGEAGRELISQLAAATGADEAAGMVEATPLVPTAAPVTLAVPDDGFAASVALDPAGADYFGFGTITDTIANWLSGHPSSGPLPTYTIGQIAAYRVGSANSDIRLSEISASMGDGNRLPRSRNNEKTPP